MNNVLKASLVLFFFALVFTCCKKSGGGGGGTTPATEENLVVALDPDPGSTTTPVKAPSGSYTFNVVIQSKMPAQGVEVKVDYKKDSDGSSIFSNTYNSTTSPISVTITNVPATDIGTVTIVVTSKSKPSNTVTKTFKLVKK